MTPLHIDGIIRIKNAYNAGLKQLTMPTNKLLEKMISLLKEEGRVENYTISGDIKKVITVSLLYKDGKAGFTEVKLHSKPGRKIYKRFSDLETVKGGKGLSLVSTPKGLMTGKSAWKNKIGGELIVALW